MKLMSKFGWTVLVCVVLTDVTWADEADTLRFSVGVDYFGKYIWRGQNLQDDGAVQPSISFSYGSLSGTIWGSIDLTNGRDVDGDGRRDNAGELTEVDYSLDWTASLGDLEGLAYSLGVINYTFPNTPFDDTTEAYVGLSLDVFLQPSVTAYHDVDDVDGTYVSFGLSHSFAEVANLAPDVPVGMDIAASVGWGSTGYNKAYWGVADGRANDLTLQMALPFEAWGWTITPSINYVTLLSHDIRASDNYSRDSDYLFAGFSLAKSF